MPPSKPHQFDMYAQPPMQPFRDRADPWLKSKKVNKLMRVLRPLTEILVNEDTQDLSSIHNKYDQTFDLAYEFGDEHLAFGPRHVGHLVGAAMRKQALEMTNGKHYITPVLPDEFAVNRYLPEDVIMLARGTNAPHNEVNPDTEAKLAWRVQAPTPGGDTRQPQLSLVGRRLKPEVEIVTLDRSDFLDLP